MRDSYAFDRLYIDGEWCSPSNAAPIDVIDSATEQCFATVPCGTPADVDRAVAAALRALPSWSATSPAERAALLRRAGELLERRGPEVATVLTRETGMPVKFSLPYQVGLPLGHFATAADVVESYEFEQTEGNSLVVRQPVGVVACITPWNFPLHLVVLKVAYALAAGCTVVLKPSEVAPVDSFILAEITDEAGIPPGVFNLVSGTGAEVGEYLVAHPDVAMTSFTGSTRAGRSIARASAESVKRVALELGGKSANVVCDDLDETAFAAAVTASVSSALLCSGQQCSGLTRILVPKHRLAEAERVAERAVSGLVLGDPFDPSTDIGPLAYAEHRDRVLGYIEDGLHSGARLVTGGPDVPAALQLGYYVRPTLFSDVEPDMTIAQEEIFGPVLVLLGYEDEDDAVRIANGTRYGLAAAVQSSDPAKAQALARRLEAGQVDINYPQFNMKAPFGGWKQSGLGREYGTYGLEEYLEIKSIQV